MPKLDKFVMKQIVMDPSPIPALVLLNGDIDMIRADQIFQDKAEAADNGMSLLRTVTPDWNIWLAPFGRAGKQSFTALHLLERTSHSLRGVPCVRPLPNSLNMPMSPFRSTGAGIGIGPVTNHHFEFADKKAILLTKLIWLR